MTITAAIVLYAVTWAMVFFVILPLRVTSQGESGTVVPGTPVSAQSGFVIKRKAWLTTLYGTAVWAILCAIILSNIIGVRDFDWMNRMPPVSQTGN
jgi:predicted secreted protein